MSDVETALTGAQVAPAETPATPEQPQVQAQESTTEQVEAQPDKPRDDKGRFVPQERLNEVTRARREAERRADALERELASYRQQPAHQPQSHEATPSLSSFNSVEEWATAVAQHAEQRALRTAEQKFQQFDSQRRYEQVASTFAEKEQRFAATNPDYYDRVAEMTSVVQFAPEVVEALALSDHSAALAYHLASHLDEADRIARLPPHIAAVHLGRLEAQLSSPRPKPVTNAPTPAPVLGGGGKAAPALRDGLSYAEYKAVRMKGGG